MSEYQALTAAGRTLSTIKCEISNEDGSYTSAAWKMVYHAEVYVTKLAEAELRGAACTDTVRPIVRGWFGAHKARR